MRKFISLIVIWSCFCFIFSTFAYHRSICPQSSKIQVITPELSQLVINFFDLLKEKDSEKLFNLWSHNSPHKDSYRKIVETLFATDRTLTVIEQEPIEFDANKATIRIKILVENRDGSSNNRSRNSSEKFRLLKFVKENGWKIWNELSIEEDIANKLMAANNDEERNTILTKEKNYLSLDLSKLLLQESYPLAKQLNFEKAKIGLEMALQIAEQYRQDTDDFKKILAAILNNLGNAYTKLNQSELAFEVLQKSLTLKRELNDKNGQSITLNLLGNLCENQHDYVKALDYYNQSLTIKKELGDSKGSSLVLNNIGVIYMGQKDYDHALATYQNSLSIKEKNDYIGIARTWNNIGNMYFFQEINYSAALAAYNNGLSIINNDETNEGKAVRALLLSNRAGFYRRKRDYRRAFIDYQNTLGLVQVLGDSTGIATANSGIGIIYQEQGLSDHALDYYEKSLSLRIKLNDQRGVAFIYNLMGNAYKAKANYNLAQEYYDKSLILYQQLKEFENKAMVLRNRGNLYLLQKQVDCAADLFQQSLSITEISQTLKMDLLCDLAVIYQQKGDYEKALKCAQDSINLAEQLNDQDIYWQSRNIAGEIYQHLNSPEKAKLCFENAIDIIESIRNKNISIEWDRSRAFEDKHAPYHSLIEILLEQEQKEKALIYSESIHARVLLDLLKNGKETFRNSLTKDEQEELLQLERKIAESNNRLLLNNAEREQLSPTDQKKSAELKTESNRLKEELDRQRRKLEDCLLRQYAKSTRLSASNIDLSTLTGADFFKLVPDSNTAVLEFLVTDKEVVLFVLSKTDDHQPNREQVENSAKQDLLSFLKVYRIPISKEVLIANIKDFYNALAKNDKSSYLPLSLSLYKILLEPAKEQLKDKHNLIIVPDNILWNLPFQALRNKDQKGFSYLIDHYVISYAPSLLALSKMVQGTDKEVKNRESILGFGNPALDKELISTDQIDSTMKRFNTLKDAEVLIEQLVEKYGDNQSKRYIGLDATESNFKRSLNKHYSSIVMATHGVFDDKNPIYSYLLLAKSNTIDEDDGLLEAREIIGLNLNTDMVILSACDTGLGRLSDGEGLIGFSWSIFMAGCPTTLVTQWQVRSDSTRDLILAFYEKLLVADVNSSKTISKAEALRRAILKVKSQPEYASPYFWAAFNIIGAAN